MAKTATTKKEITPCAFARERYGPGKDFTIRAFEQHAKSCAECSKVVRDLKRSQKTRATYSREFPLTGDVHKYLLITPAPLWSAFEKRRGQTSARTVLLKLLTHYAEHGLPS